MFGRQAASSGRDSVRYAHSGPSQRLRRPRFTGTCIRRAPPPARVRGWTRPPAAASRRLPSSRVQISLSCPRDLLAAASRVQNRPPCPRKRVTDVLPAVCQQRAGLRSLCSLRPLPTSTASPLCGNLYPPGPSPSPCPCPGLDTPARRSIPPAPALPVCKTALSAPGTGLLRLPVCKSALPAPGTSSPRPPVCKTALPAPGTYSLRPPVCKSALLAPGTSSPRLPVCKTGLSAPGSSSPRDRKR